VAGKGDPISDLIGRVYDAALDSRLWPDVSAGIAQALQSPSGGILIHRPAETKPQWLARSDNLLALSDGYEQHFHRMDVWAQRAAHKELGRIFNSQELISDAEFVRTEFYNDWCRKADIFQVIGSVFRVSDGAISVLGIHRPKRSNQYGEGERHLLGRIFPHVERAVRLYQRVSVAAVERQATLDTLARTGLATLVVGRNGLLLYVSPDAHLLLGDNDPLTVTAGKLVAKQPVMAKRLAQAIETAVDVASDRDGMPARAIALPRADRLPLTVLVAPFRPARDGFGAQAPAAILFVRDPERGTRTAALQDLFDLTSTEACVAAALSDGHSVDTFAAANGVSINTVKTHLKSVMLKTGTRRQAELVSLVLRTVATLNDR
jgi:DNA-binding CsgD family transcriptional regulator